jgi:hypothetical protein
MRGRGAADEVVSGSSFAGDEGRVEPTAKATGRIERGRYQCTGHIRIQGSVRMRIDADKSRGTPMNYNAGITPLEG